MRIIDKLRKINCRYLAITAFFSTAAGMIFYRSMLGAAAVAQIFTYMSLYNIFEDYYPKNKVLFTILSIFVSLAAPIIIFALRNKPPVSIVSPKGYWSNGAYINNNTFNNYNSQFFE